MSGIAVLHLYKAGDAVIVAMSQRRAENELRFVMSLEFRHTQAPTNPEEFGRMLLAALDDSAALPPTNADPKERSKQWQQAISKEGIFDTWRAFRKAALLVDVFRNEGDKVQVAPAVHAGTGFMLLSEKMETLHEPTPEQLGAAAQRAFKLSQ